MMVWCSAAIRDFLKAALDGALRTVTVMGDGHCVLT